jgi:hypothetical protein
MDIYGNKRYTLQYNRVFRSYTYYNEELYDFQRFDDIVYVLTKDRKKGFGTLYSVDDENLIFSVKEDETIYSINGGKWKTFSILEKVPGRFHKFFLLELFIAYALASANDSI